MYELNLENDIDIAQLAKDNPEKAAIIIDYSIKNQVSNERESWIQRANMIFFLKTNDLWQHHPENFKSFFEYCSQSEVDIAPSVASDMIALCTYAPILADEDIDIWEVVRKSGHSKVRQIIPQIREAHRNGVIREEVGPVIDALSGMSFKEVIQLTGTSNVRSTYELEAYYNEDKNGEISVEFRNLDIDDLEYLSRKAGIKRWYDNNGMRIDPPMNEVKAIK